MMIKTQRHRGRNTTYGVLVALALTLGGVVPAQAASLTGPTAFRVIASASVSKSSVKVKKPIKATSKITYEAYLLGIPLPTTAVHINSIPVTFKKPVAEFTQNADRAAKKYVKKRDAWLGAKQWVSLSETTFYGKTTIVVRGKATAHKKGKKYFHAGTGSGHLADANALKRVTVK